MKKLLVVVFALLSCGAAFAANAVDAAKVTFDFNRRAIPEYEYNRLVSDKDSKDFLDKLGYAPVPATEAELNQYINTRKMVSEREINKLKEEIKVTTEPEKKKMMEDAVKKMQLPSREELIKQHGKNMYKLPADIKACKVISVNENEISKDIALEVGCNYSTRIDEKFLDTKFGRISYRKLYQDFKVYDAKDQQILNNYAIKAIDNKGRNTVFTIGPKN